MRGGRRRRATAVTAAWGASARSRCRRGPRRAGFARPRGDRPAREDRDAGTAQAFPRRRTRPRPGARAPARAGRGGRGRRGRSGSSAPGPRRRGWRRRVSAHALRHRGGVQRRAAHGVGRRVGSPARASVRARDRRGDARHRALPLLGAPGLPRPDRVRADARAGRRRGARTGDHAPLRRAGAVDPGRRDGAASLLRGGVRQRPPRSRVQAMAPTTRTHADFLVRIAAQGDRAGPTRTSAAASSTAAGRCQAQQTGWPYRSRGTARDARRPAPAPSL